MGKGGIHRAALRSPTAPSGASLLPQEPHSPPPPPGAPLSPPGLGGQVVVQD